MMATLSSIRLLDEVAAYALVSRRKRDRVAFDWQEHVIRRGHLRGDINCGYIPRSLRDRCQGDYLPIKYRHRAPNDCTIHRR